MNLKHLLTQSFNIDTWKGILSDIFSNIDYFTSVVPIIDKDIKSGGHIGTIHLMSKQNIAIFSLEVADNICIERNRKGLRDISARYVDQSLTHGILVFYHSKKQKDYRLTYISKQTSFTETGEFVQSETAPKRYTFLLGENEPCTTAALRLSELKEKSKTTLLSINDISEAFSVERLNKAFFNGYKEQYAKFLKYLNSDTKQNRDYVKKLLGRLVFLQFLQKKGWMGVPADSPMWERGDKNYLLNLIDRHKGKDTLLTDVLEPLFFDTLNNKRTDDIALPILGNNIRIPYLNGGLFERDNIDKLNIDFPYTYFYALLDFFSQYNFTIDENDPNDAEVGIDPEMLGHIFENLLEDNKDKGAFYTPKEIVQYMCRQSLIEYLKSKTAEQHSDWETHIAKLINTHKLSEEMQDNKIFLADIQLHLKEVKICDPAIGSGAFPMGILYELFHCRQILYGHSLEKQSFTPAEIKREIIQNSIYGVDIEQGAVDIARLRFWLSLVVDEEEPQPLPNLDYKIVCGNSLITTFCGKFIDLNRKKGDNFIKIKNKKKELFKLQSDFYSLSGEDKYAKEADIKRHIIDIIQLQLDYQLDSSIEKKYAVGNLFEEQNQHKVKKQHQTSPELGEQLVVLKSIKIRLNNPERTTEEIAKTNIPFFDWEIMFPDIFIDETPSKRGFDIVIGNPPYIQLQDNGGALANIYKDCGFETFVGTGDIYYLFYEKAWQLLSNDGILAYITSKTWMRTKAGEKIRSFFYDKTNPLRLIDFAGTKVFESATVNTNILIFSKSENKDNTQCTKVESKDSLKDLSLFVQQNSTEFTFSGSDSWVILSPIEQSIKRKIEAVGTPLKDWDIQINYGIKTGCNEAFIISTEKRNEILSQCDTEDERKRTEELIRPILRGRDIKRYSAEWGAGLWLIATFPSRKYDIEQYPSIEQYLTEGEWRYSLRNDSFKDVKRNGCGKFRLEQSGKTHNIDGISFKARKKTNNKWFETQDSINYWEDFSKPKIVYQELSQGSAFFFDNNATYTVSNSGYIITGDNIKYLFALLNTKFIEFCFKQFYSITIGETGVRWLKQYVEKLPIIVHLDHSNELIELSNKILDLKQGGYETAMHEKQIDDIIYKLYGLTQEEISIIEILQ